MADDTKPATLLPTEIIPSVVGELSAIASAQAPFIFFEGAANYGFNEGIANVTLEASRNLLVQGAGPARSSRSSSSPNELVGRTKSARSARRRSFDSHAEATWRSALAQHEFIGHLEVGGWDVLQKAEGQHFFPNGLG